MNAARLLLIVGFAAGFASAPPAADPAAPAQAPGHTTDSRARPNPWLERLETWVTAVVQHEPGKPDEPAHAIGRWPEPDLQEVLDTIVALREILVREDQRLARSATIPYSPPLVTYKKQQVPLRELQDIFGRAGDEARRGDVNRLLRRGALLHADIAILSQWDTDGWPNVAGVGQITLAIDGRAIGYGGLVVHWEFGRALLDALTPDPARDETARFWYHAMAAHMLSAGHLAAAEPHLHHAMRLFAQDADILLEAGSFHEVLASPRVQSVLQTMRAQNPRFTSALTDRSAEAQLRDAEDLFRRAVRANPDLVEARVRLAHVLSARGRYAEAAPELRGVLEASPEPQLRYYAEMLLGDAEQALGRREAARACYERAAALYPSAQSPHLALSQLARRGGDRAGALRAIQQVLSLRPDEHLWRSDPWWVYSVWQSRSADDLLQALRARIVSEGRR